MAACVLVPLRKQLLNKQLEQVHLKELLSFNRIIMPNVVNVKKRGATKA